MARCQCGVELTGRRRKCDACKARPGKVEAAPTKKPAAKKASSKSQAKKRPARKAAAKKTLPAAPVQSPDPDEVPAGLHDRGRALWVTLGQKLDSPAGQIALESCRAADRLDELDSIIAGKGVLNLLAFRTHLDLEDMLADEQHLRITVGFQNVLAEARQQQANFRALLAEISDIVPAAPKSPPASGPKKSPLDELAERRAKK